MTPQNNPEFTGPPAPALADVATAAETQAWQAQWAALAQTVLEAGELANRSAVAHATAGQRLEAAEAALAARTERLQRQQRWTLGACAAVSVMSLLVSAVVVGQVSNRTAQLDATVLAVGKRFVEMRNGLEALTVLQDNLAEMQAKQEAYAVLQAKIATNLEEANKLSQGLVTQVPQATAKEVQARSQALAAQLQAIDGRVSAQAGTLRKMAEDMRALQGQGESMGTLRKEVQALVMLQKDKAVDGLRPASTAAGTSSAPSAPSTPATPRGVHYPRVTPAPTNP